MGRSAGQARLLRGKSPSESEEASGEGPKQQSHHPGCECLSSNRLRAPPYPRHLNQPSSPSPLPPHSRPSVLYSSLQHPCTTLAAASAVPLCDSHAACCRVECTKELSDASHAASNMRYWRVLAWFLGSAETACLAYTKTCRACDCKALPSLEPWDFLLLDTLAKVWHDVRPEQARFRLPSDCRYCLLWLSQGGPMQTPTWYQHCKPS